MIWFQPFKHHRPCCLQELPASIKIFFLVSRFTLVPTVNGSNKTSNDDTKNGSSYALIASMSHMAADGYTNYRILSMLSLDKPIVTLNPQRKPIETSQVAWDPADWKFVTMNIGFIGKLIWGMIRGTRAKCFAYYVHDDKIAAIKEEYKDHNANVKFVSTNDILVSNHSTLVRPRIQTMAINFRNRVPNAENQRCWQL
jgi:hypothetical protein